jgi:hypothetical protein
MRTLIFFFMAVAVIAVTIVEWRLRDVATRPRWLACSAVDRREQVSQRRCPRAPSYSWLFVTRQVGAASGLEARFDVVQHRIQFRESVDNVMCPGLL